MDRHVTAFTRSFNALYANQYGSTWHEAETHTLTDYGPHHAERMPFRWEVVTQTWPIEVPGDGPLVVNLFHEEQEEPALDGLEHLYTTALLGRTLDGAYPQPAHAIHEVATPEAIAVINAMVERDGTSLHAALLVEGTIRAFFTAEGSHATAYGLMVTAVPGVLYVATMYTAPAMRRRGLAASLLAYMHREAEASGCTEALLVPSYVAQGYYHKHGYEARRVFSVYERG